MSEPARILGIDYGAARIGIALSDPLRLFARPHSVILHHSRDDDLDAIRRIATEEQVAKIVIGLPTNSEGGVGPQAQIVIRWALKLAPRIGLPVVFWDESYSSKTAEGLYRPPKKWSGKRKRHSNQALDHVAAAAMLQEYLDAGGGENEPGWPLESFSHYG